MQTEGPTEKVKMGLGYGIYTIHNFSCISMMLNLLLAQNTALQDLGGAASWHQANTKQTANLCFWIICGNPDDTGKKRVVGVSASGFLDGFSSQCVSVCVCVHPSDVFIFQLGS